MYFLPIIILALVQGITEFLPISSSGHLVLIHALSNENLSANWDEDLMLDVAVHVGTLFSVLLYFWRDVAGMIKAPISLMTKSKGNEAGQRQLGFVLISSIPVIMAGFLIHHLEPSWIRSLEIMAWATLGFGVMLWAVDHFKPHQYTISDMTWKGAILIGIAQALALIPGTSRSGITMTAARYLGYSRIESAHFSLLMAIVAIAGAGTLATKDLVESGNVALTLEAFIAALLSFVSGLISIALMMKWLEKASFTPFAIYRVIMGLALLALIYSGAMNEITFVSP